MTRVGLVGYLDHMHEAATLAHGYVAEMTEAQFLSDKKTQQAVIFNIVVLGRSRDGADEGAWRLRRRAPSDSVAQHQGHAQSHRACLLRHQS
jgi:hypothetical protein